MNAQELLFSYTLLKKWILCILGPHKSILWCTWLLSSPRASNISYHWVFFTFSCFHVHGLCHFASLNIWDYYRLVDSGFFRSAGIFDDHLILPLILPSTIFIALSFFLNHHHCLFILRSERDWRVSSCSEFFQYWVMFYGYHSIELRHKLIGWFLYGIYRFYLVYFRWIVSLP